MPERVADYPRPPRLEPSSRLVRIRLGGEWVAETRSAFRVLETFHPPSWYLPPEAFRPGALHPAAGSSFCEWKGVAAYWDIAWNGRTAGRAGWSYPEPTPGFAAIRDHVAVYAGLMEECRVDEEVVLPQPGGFYGGWITSELVGPFKGGPGTMGW
ncbi:DUF427 domain-containing protein [Falsiroseomonas sp. E2-1-a20]|uniref:DUF427 domain-containing protein n=1 Tax=Falsiroseomonas sp. E2-1-a20 TaxID=3239300 RepID=UPI003F2A5EAC